MTKPTPQASPIRPWACVTLLAAALAASLPAQAQAPVESPTDELRAASRQLDGAVRGWIAAGDLPRKDGYVYSADVAPLLLYAARIRDEKLYSALLPYAQKLIVTGNDPATSGFVLWRAKSGQSPEVTGAAESLWMARALWQGASAFHRDNDKQWALRILGGYARHAADTGGTWRVRRYYSFATKTFAELSMISAYDGDFLAATEGETRNAAWAGYGKRAYGVLDTAATPLGLSYPVIQPAVAEVYPGLGVQAYAPNGALVLEDACAAAEGALQGRPELGKKLLKFTESYERRDEDTGRLYAYYRAGTGKPIGKRPLSSLGYACLVRVAATLNDRTRLADFDMTLRGDMRSLAKERGDMPFLAAGPLLLAAHAAGGFTPSPKPAAAESAAEGETE